MIQEPRIERSGAPSQLQQSFDRISNVSGGAVETEGAVDIAVVVVHGMGRQRRNQTLLEWAEPLLARIDNLVTADEHNDAIGGQPSANGIRANGVDTNGGRENGVRAKRVRLSTDGDSEIVAEITSGAASSTTRTIRITEARWSDSFLPMTSSEVFRWGALFLWKALIRMGTHFTRTVFLAPVTELRATLGRPWRLESVTPADWMLAALSLLALIAVFPLTALVVAVIWVGLFALGAVLFAILPFLGVLLLVPALVSVLQPLVDVLVEFVGDVGVWREKPLRAAAMQEVVRTEILNAKASLRTGSGVGVPVGSVEGPQADVAQGAESGAETSASEPILSVIAHSQGAAISARVLFDQRDRAALGVSTFTTVGAAVTLLGGSSWRRASSVRMPGFHPVSDWLELEPPLPWHNYWAVWDPFSAGPIADSRWASKARWRLAYDLPRAGDEKAYGPSEHPVHNTANPLSDHQSYAANIDQVVDPIARHLLGLDTGLAVDGMSTSGAAARPSPGQRALRTRNRRHVSSVKSRGVEALAGVILGAAVALGAGAQSVVASVIRTLDVPVTGVVTWIGSLLPSTDDVAAVSSGAGSTGESGAASNAPSALGFLLSRDDDPPLSLLGAVAAFAVIVAVITKIADMTRQRVKQALDYEQPRFAARVLIADAVFRLLLVGVTAWLVRLALAERMPRGWGLSVLVALIAVGAVASFVSPLIARVPRVVRESRPSAAPESGAEVTLGSEREAAPESEPEAAPESGPEATLEAPAEVTQMHRAKDTQLLRVRSSSDP